MYIIKCTLILTFNGFRGLGVGYIGLVGWWGVFWALIDCFRTWGLGFGGLKVCLRLMETDFGLGRDGFRLGRDGFGYGFRGFGVGKIGFLGWWVGFWGLVGRAGTWGVELNDGTLCLGLVMVNFGLVRDSFGLGRAGFGL